MKQTNRIERPTTERSHDNKNYNLYCINFNGTGLDSIKGEFKQQIQSGLRRSVFVIDLKDIQQELDKQPRTTKLRLDSNENRRHCLMNAVVTAIKNVRKENDLITKKINEELKFDLYQYWLKNLEDKQTPSVVDTASLGTELSLKMPVKGESKITKKSKASKKSLLRNQSIVRTEDKETVTCLPLVLREHNRVAQSEMLSKRKYINDEPSGGKLYIIIMGHMDNQFYADLLSRGQPVQSIVHFLPTESNYDILLNNNKLQTFIVDTLESINSSFYELRQTEATKSVGLFSYDLPVISTCLAAKYQKDIYDQLTWCVYDIEVLQQQYQLYYCQPFQVTDVALPLNVGPQQLCNVAKTLNVQGHFQRHSLPGCSSDIITILAYLDNLLNMCDVTGNILNAKEITDHKNQLINNTSKCNSSAFESITKIGKYERLFIEETNPLLDNMLLYAEQVTFKNIYLLSLVYNLWRRYLKTSYLKEKTTCNSFCPSMEPSSLPGFAKLYPSEDGCAQRISDLHATHDYYHITEIQSGYKVYTFRKIYNCVVADERLEVVPTRLCFRDFTLFQRFEFLENLVTPDMREGTKRSTLINDSVEKEIKLLDLDKNIFIRPNSLKAIKLAAEKESEGQTQIHNRSRLYDKKLYVTENSSLPDEWVGLPPDHHLIKGYNLEDIRQEVQCKTTKYSFDHGYIHLYEERWCFEDTNKVLIFSINDSSIFFNHPRQQAEVISNNIRLETKNNINIRIFNEPMEWAKVVLNYPHGLAVHYHEMDCEQIWFSAETFNDEQRRLYTPYGAILVFFKAENMILIMRYNGEVYELYQYEFPEEQEEHEIPSDFTDNQSFGFSDDLAKAKGDNVQITRSEQKTEITQTESLKIKVSSSPTSVVDVDLKTLIYNELAYLHFISTAYELSYRHLILTTSQGRRIHLTHQGKIVEKSACKTEEWHDYYVNETYCNRSDGVKMIWTQGSLKCYHKDGTVFTTKTVELFQQLNVDEFESDISQSSSHGQIVEERENVDKAQPPYVSPPTKKSTIVTTDFLTPGQTKSTKYSAYLVPEGVEEHVVGDTGFLCYTCSSWLMQHHHYAEVNIVRLEPSAPTQTSVLIEVSGIGNIFIYAAAKDQVKEVSRCCGEEGDVSEKDCQLLLNVWIDDNLRLTVDQESCEIYAIMEHQPQNENLARDSLTLRVLYKDCLNDVFKYFINEIATFQNYNGPKTEDIYFVESTGPDGKLNGFELVRCLPKTTGYVHTSGNCTLEVKPVKNIRVLMTHNYVWFANDMKKFPRFPVEYKAKKLFTGEPDFPKVCSTSIYCKLPPALQNTKHVTSFLEPLKNINFKKLRRKIKQLLDEHLTTQLQLNVKSLYSHNSWLKRHREHERRKFTEQQRMGLYHAMLKHCIYPDYFTFNFNYEGHVRYIDFFKFMQFQCGNKQIKKEEVYWKLQNSRCNQEIKKYETYDK